MTTKNLLNKLINFGTGVLIAGNLIYSTATANNTEKHVGIGKYGGMKVSGKDTSYYLITNKEVSKEMTNYFQETSDGKSIYKISAQDLRENGLEDEFKELARYNKDEGIKIQRGIQQGNNFKETKDSITIEYPLNKNLQDAIGGASKPYVFLNGVNGSIETNKDTTKLYVTVAKSDLGKKVSIGVGDKDGVIMPCDENGLGRKTNSLASLWTYLNYEGVGKAKQDTTQTSIQTPTGNGEETFVDKSINTIYGDTINNNYYAKADSTKKESKLRTLLEVGKYIPGKEGYVGGAIQVPLSENFYLGLEGRGIFGKNVTNDVEQINYSQPVTENIIFNSEGLNNTTIETSHPFQAGVLATYLKGKFGINASAGINARKTKTHTLNKGTDFTTDKSGNVLEEKSYCVENFDNKSSTDAYLNLSGDYFVTPNISIGAEVEANDLISKPNVFGGINMKFILSGGKKNEN